MNVLPPMKTRAALAEHCKADIGDCGVIVLVIIGLFARFRMTA
jgi:hypothetical protein